MDLELHGKGAIITGSSRGIGKHIAIALAREGCNVAISGRTRETLTVTADEIRDLGVAVSPVVVDLTEPGAADRIVGDAQRAFGRIDVLVNCVGGGRGSTFLESNDADWQGVMDVNVFPAIRAARSVIPHMREHGGGSIIMISSIYGREVAPLPSEAPAYSAPYHLAKVGEIALAATMARELAPLGIRVNAVAPGSIMFPGGSWARRQSADPARIERFVQQEMPLGRFGRPEEVAAVVTFLASPVASLVTGTCIPVDGGQTRTLI